MRADIYRLQRVAVGQSDARGLNMMPAAAMRCFQDCASIFKQLGDYFDTINNDVLEDVSNYDFALEFRRNPFKK